MPLSASATPPVSASAPPLPAVGWRSIALSLGRSFEEAALAPGEDRQAYLHLREALLDAVAPSDAIELIWARDAADLEWELRRLRPVKAVALASNRVRILADLLQKKPTVGPARKAAVRLAEAYFADDPQAREEVEQRLHALGRRIEDLASRAYAENRLSLKPLEDLIAATERRRDKLLKEVEHRRKSFAQRLRWAAEQVRASDQEAQSSAGVQARAPGDEQPDGVLDHCRAAEMQKRGWDEWLLLQPTADQACRGGTEVADPAVALQTAVTEEDRAHAPSTLAGGATQDRCRDDAGAPAPGAQQDEPATRAVAPAPGQYEDERLRRLPTPLENEGPCPRSPAVRDDERLRQPPSPHPREIRRQGRG